MKRLNFPLGAVPVDDIQCINLAKRKIRRKTMKKEARKKGFPLRFVAAVENETLPNLGKFESHLRCIATAQKYNLRNVLVLEDDIKVLSNKFRAPPPPTSWDMLFLGGNIQAVMEDNDTDNSKLWKRACNLMCHAYIVNHSAYEPILTAGWKRLKEAQLASDATLHLDEWYCTVIQPTLRSYITTPEYVIQHDGFSDVKKKVVAYRQQMTQGTGAAVPPIALDRPACEEVFAEDGVTKLMRIKMPECTDEDLPPVALITCVRNQVDLFQLCQYAYYTIDYPRDKLMWIIVDDSAHEDKVSPLIDGKDVSIKYVSCKMASDSDFLSIAKKMNIAMSYVGGVTKYIMHFALEAFYKPGHVKARVRLMMANPEYGCFGCTRYGVYDMSSKKSWEQVSTDSAGNSTILYGPSLSFTKDFWLERSFDEMQYTMESFYFIKGRWNRVMEIPYNFVLVALTWENNLMNETSRYGIKGKAVTSSAVGYASEEAMVHENGLLSDAANGNARRVETTLDYSSEWDMATQNMILMLGSILVAAQQ